MKITQLYTYPIKSLRAVPLESTYLTNHGLPFDRHFMLLKVHATPRPKTGSRLENMHVSDFPLMTRFEQSLKLDPTGKDGGLVVTFKPPGGSGSEGKASEDGSKVLEIPLRPAVKGLDVVDVDMNRSKTKAYDMGRAYSDWFSGCFGYEVKLVYLGENSRPVLGNLNPAATASKTSGTKDQLTPIEIFAAVLGIAGGALAARWGIVTPMVGLAAAMPWLESLSSELSDRIMNFIMNCIMSTEEYGITFQDVASYLIVTEQSLADVSKRLPNGEKMDMTKFRPNIVVSAPENEAWEEDFWAGLEIRSSSPTSESTTSASPSAAELILTANCARCKSITIDYNTGDYGKGEAGKVLKMLMKDRRVDSGTKYSPVFGRYGFLKGKDGGGKDRKLVLAMRLLLRARIKKGLSLSGLA